MVYKTDKFDGRIAQLLKGGAVGFMPADTIYGLSCAALNEDAVNKLKTLKRRDENKAFIVLISDIQMLDLLSINKEQVGPAEKYWPGPLTFECEASSAPSWLPKIDGHFGIRIPDKPELLRLIAETGPLVSTSANLGGEPPARNYEEVQKVFGDRLDFYVDQGEIAGQPSTLVRNNQGKLEVLRQGVVRVF